MSKACLDINETSTMPTEIKPNFTNCKIMIISVKDSEAVTNW